MLLMFVLGTSMSGFAQSEKSAIETTIEQVSNKMKEAPSGTKYGIVKSTPEKYVVNTPIGEYDVKKEAKNEYSIFGIRIKVQTVKKNSIYIFDTSLGKFKLNLNKVSLIKL